VSSQGWWSGGFGGSVVYAASKGGIVSMTRGLARSLGPAGICVNCIAPGNIDTPMLMQDLDPNALDSIHRNTPLGRLGRPDEVASVAVFLLSTHASFVSGATLNVSGAFLMY
jgi:NAD(P)-dependent dehydrogenase (short-subunit alcohol dehydrogenase family)